MNKLKNIIPEKVYIKFLDIYNTFFTDYATKTYSQEGEDLILRKIFDKQEDGFYIDIGAHHPKRFSNTYYFYKKGWSGINIEARPGSKILFDKIRPRDINLEQAISSEPSELKYYMYNEPALNGFSLPNVNNLKDHPNYRIVKELNLLTERLDTILNNNINSERSIDFMSVDVEGLDYDVIVSNNWNLYKPRIVLVEDPEYDFKLGSKISKFLESNNYQIFARTFNTSFYRLI